MPYTKVGHFESFSNASPGRGDSKESHSVEGVGYQTSTSSEDASMTKKDKSGQQGLGASSSTGVPYGECRAFSSTTNKKRIAPHGVGHAGGLGSMTPSPQESRPITLPTTSAPPMVHPTAPHHGSMKVLRHSSKIVAAMPQLRKGEINQKKNPLRRHEHFFPDISLTLNGKSD